MAHGAPPGWYPPEPDRPNELRYWDGRSWWLDYTPEQARAAVAPRPAAPGRHAAATHPSPTPRWWVSWPAILVGFLACLVPGFLLLWLRPQSSIRTKGLVTAGVVASLALLVAVAPPPPDSGTPAASSTTGASSASPSTSAASATVEPSPSSATPTPTATASPARTTTAAAKGTALAAALALPVKGRAPKTGYDRDQFGPAWVDVDRNGCDTRNDVLRRYLTDRVMSGSCKVLSGRLADPYTGRSIQFVRGGTSEVDIDHRVALSDAWQKGAQKWPYAKRVAFANDPLNLQPTDASANRQKGDSDAASWLPPNKAYRCSYVAAQVAVKRKYGLWVTAAEREAMVRVLSACPNVELPGPGPQPTLASNTGGSTGGGSTPAPRPSKTSRGTDPRFGTCREAIAAGYGPYVEGRDPEYAWYRDSDGDGMVCER